MLHGSQFLDLSSKLLLLIVAAALLNGILMNFLFFPECNRITGDCFLIQHLWGAQ